MIVRVPNSAARLVLPDGYAQEKPSARTRSDGSALYRKQTENADCYILLSRSDRAHSLCGKSREELIAEFHAGQEDNQGLLEVGAGVTARGWTYGYCLFKNHDIGPVPGGMTYGAALSMEKDGEAIEAGGRFEEIGTTGERESLGFFLAAKAGLVGRADEKGRLIGWMEDPYDPAFTKGALMNISEREGLDSLLPAHPLSQAREFLHAVLYDELMLPVEEASKTEDAQPGDEEEKAALLALFDKAAKRNFVPKKENVPADM